MIIFYYQNSNPKDPLNLFAQIKSFCPGCHITIWIILRYLKFYCNIQISISPLASNNDC